MNGTRTTDSTNVDRGITTPTDTSVVEISTGDQTGITETQTKTASEIKIEGEVIKETNKNRTSETNIGVINGHLPEETTHAQIQSSVSTNVRQDQSNIDEVARRTKSLRSEKSRKFVEPYVARGKRPVFNRPKDTNPDELNLDTDRGYPATPGDDTLLSESGQNIASHREIPSHLVVNESIDSTSSPQPIQPVLTLEITPVRDTDENLSEALSNEMLSTSETSWPTSVDRHQNNLFSSAATEFPNVGTSETLSDTTNPSAVEIVSRDQTQRNEKTETVTETKIETLGDVTKGPTRETSTEDIPTDTMDTTAAKIMSREQTETNKITVSGVAKDTTKNEKSTHAITKTEISTTIVNVPTGGTSSPAGTIETLVTTGIDMTVTIPPIITTALTTTTTAMTTTTTAPRLVITTTTTLSKTTTTTTTTTTTLAITTNTTLSTTTTCTTTTTTTVTTSITTSNTNTDSLTNAVTTSPTTRWSGTSDPQAQPFTAVVTGNSIRKLRSKFEENMTSGQDNGPTPTKDLSLDFLSLRNRFEQEQGSGDPQLKRDVLRVQSVRERLNAIVRQGKEDVKSEPKATPTMRKAYSTKSVDPTVQAARERLLREREERMERERQAAQAVDKQVKSVSNYRTESEGP
eukprot:TRINITY_DN3245_c0_g1_i4.p1 TRINITY_DN3245_c0_g1~~TRINITY_DN3245_c0_g1_i4.p1  ORF type:complete len:633 (-),score=112.33 TRINITY_DN3245_c0_g1_i4:142-2040(-)